MSLLNLIKLESAGSTNEHASRILQNATAAEYTVIWTLNQYSGRGTGGTNWESEAGKNLTFSIILHPYFLDVSRQFVLNQIIALGVYDFVRSLADTDAVTIKWPNDIYIHNSKVAGILIQNAVMEGKFRYSIAGVGINMNQSVFSAVIPNPVSLRGITGKIYNLEENLHKACNAIIERYKVLARDPAEVNTDEYISKLYRYNILSKYRYNNETIEARITGVAEAGHLQLETQSGKQIECDLKEIVFLQED